jgi:hypothetical protein
MTPDDGGRTGVVWKLRRQNYGRYGDIALYSAAIRGTVRYRGNGRARVFFEPGDYALYRELLMQSCRGRTSRCGLGAWSEPRAIVAALVEQLAYGTEKIWKNVESKLPAKKAAE